MSRRNVERDRKHSLAWNRALSELRERHLREFRDLYDEHRYLIDAEEAVFGRVLRYKGKRDADGGQDEAVAQTTQQSGAEDRVGIEGPDSQGRSGPSVGVSASAGVKVSALQAPSRGE